MTQEEKINSVIGKPYDAYKAHCWDLVEFLVEGAPKVDLTANTLLMSVKNFKEEIPASNLKEVSNYMNNDIILLGRNNTFFHAGVYYNDGVVHAGENGVVYEPLKTIKQYYTLIQGLRA